MRDLYVGTDFHLWSDKPDSRHPYRSQSSIGKLSANYGACIQEDDMFVFLGDLCDPEITDKTELTSIISPIRGYKVMCRGNHDTMDDDFYKEIGFDVVCDICKIHNLVFSHKPVRVSPDELNIHGHLHTRKLSGAGYQHINAYGINHGKIDQPILVDDLIDGAAVQDPDSMKKEYWEKDGNLYQSMEDDDVYSNIIDLTDMVTIVPLDESANEGTCEPDTGNQLNEILFQDIEQTEYWLQDDDYKPGSRKKEPMTDGEGTLDEASSHSAASLYFVSERSDFDKTIVQPRIPNNYMTKNGYEDGKTARVCFSTSIDGCLRGLSKNCTGMELYVYQPVLNGQKIITPTTKQVPDANITKERWITEPVELVCIGKIEVVKDAGKPGHTYKYGNNTAELYDWEWHWIERGNLGGLNESAAPPMDILTNLFHDTKEMVPVYKDGSTKYSKFRKDIVRLSAVPPVLYHGSPVKISTLKPHYCHGPDEKLVFATASYEFALPFAGAPWIDIDINQCTYNGEYMLTEILPGKFDELFNRKGYIYHLKSDGFEQYRRNEYISRRAVKPVKVDVIPNVLAELEKRGVTLNRFPKLPPFIEDRMEYLRKRTSKYGQDINKLIRMYGDALNETALTEAVTFQDVKKIVNRIPRDEHNHFYHGPQFKDSPFVKYRDVTYVSHARSKAGAFIEIYVFDDTPTIGIVVIAAEPGARGQGLTDKLLQKAIREAPGLGIEKLIARIDKDNPHSYNMAIRNGFVDVSNNTVNRDQYRLEFDLTDAVGSLNKSVTPVTTDILPAIIDLNKRLNTFGYGLYVNGKYRPHSTSEDYDKYYRVTSPQEFEKQRGGICWDYAEYTATWLTKYFPDIKWTAWFIVVNNEADNPTHTLITFKHNGDIIYPESSFKKIAGVWSAKSDKDILNFVMKSMVEHTNRTRSIDLLDYQYLVFKYNATDASIPGMRTDEYMKFCMSGEKILYRYSPKYNVAELAVPDTTFKLEDYYTSIKKLKPLWYSAINQDGNPCIIYTDKKLGDDAKWGYVEIEDGEISGLNVNPKYQNHGVDTTLIRYAVDLYGATALRVHPSNKNAISLYTKLGFVSAGEIDSDGLLKMTINKASAAHLHESSYNYKDLSDVKPVDREEKKRIAEKYGLKAVGQEDNQENDEKQDTPEKRVEELRKQREKNLKKANRARARKRIVRKIKSHLPGVKNESMYIYAEGTTVDTSETDHYETDNIEDSPLYGRRKQIFPQTDMPQEEAVTLVEGVLANMIQDLAFVAKGGGDNVSYTGNYEKLQPRLMKMVDSTKSIDRLIYLRKDAYAGVRQLDILVTNMEAVQNGTQSKYVSVKDMQKRLDSGNNPQRVRSHQAWVKNEYIPHINMRIKELKEKLNEAASGYEFYIEDKSLRFLDRMNETSEDDGKLYPVYIMLMHSGTALSTAIKTVTRSNFSHSSISFDSSMHNLYSFGRKADVNPFIGGFKKEDIRNKFFKERDIPYALYMVPCTKTEIELMKKRLDYFIKNTTKFHYDFAGLFKNYFGISDNPEYKWFCSRFVADILNSGRPSSDPYVMEPSLMKPEDFRNTNFAQYVSGGFLATYDQKFVDKITTRLLRIEKARRRQKARMDKDNPIPETAYDVSYENPYLESVLNYQLTMMDESVVDHFLTYLKSFKLRFDKEGNIIITRREYDQLDSHFKSSLKMIKACEKAGNLEGVKTELAKIYYMIHLINDQYLSNKTARKSDMVKKDMLDLRSVMMNVFQQHLTYVTSLEPKFNFQSYYDGSKYGKDTEIPKATVTAIGKTVVTLLS